MCTIAKCKHTLIPLTTIGQGLNNTLPQYEVCPRVCAEKHTHPTERRVVRTIPLSQIYSIYKYIRNDIYKSRQCVRHTTKKAINEESSTQEEQNAKKQNKYAVPMCMCPAVCGFD